MIDIHELKIIVAKDYSIEPKDLLLKSRKRDIVEPRQVFHYLAKLFNPRMSLTKIGSLTGNQNHCNVIHSIKCIENLVATNHEFRTRISNIKEKCICLKDNETLDNHLNQIKWKITQSLIKCKNLSQLKKLLSNEAQNI